MDALSDVILAVRLGRSVVERIERSAPWREHFPDHPGTAGFLVLVEGRCRLVDDGAEAVPIGPGDVLFSPHGAGYRMESEPDAPSGTRTVAVSGGYLLAPDRTHPLLRELPRTIHLPRDGDRHPDLRACVDQLAAEIEGDRPGGDAMLQVLVDALLLHVLRAWLDQAPGSGAGGGWAAALADPAVRAALDAVHTAPGTRWTVPRLAERSRTSRATLSRRFTALVGQPPLRYLTWWRMTLAATRLRDSTDPIAAIARDVGYTSEYAFSTAFTRHTGTAPGAYRRRTRGSRPRR